VGLYVRASGLAGAPSVVFLHGGVASGWAWDPVVERLAGRYHCLAPDLPEHGRSVGRGPFSIAGAAGDVAALVRERAHGRRAHLVGISVGGQIALQVAATAPELVDRLVLSGTLVAPPRPPHGRRGPTLLDALDLLFRVLTPVRDNPLLIRGVLRLSRIPPRYLLQYRADARQATRAGLMRTIVENGTYRPPVPLGTIVAPTLVVVGADEPPILQQSTRLLAVALPNAVGRAVPGVAHSWNLEAPDRFAEVVRAWLAGESLPPWLLPLTS